MRYAGAQEEGGSRLTGSSVQQQLPQAANTMPSNLATSHAQLLPAPWTAPERSHLTDTAIDGRQSQHLRLVTRTPPRGSIAREASVAPVACLFICHTMRCGSTLLCDGLSSSGVAGDAEEYFPERAPDGTVFVAAGAALKDPDTWGCDWQRAPFDECLKRVLRNGTTPNGVFASKVKWPNVPYLGEMLGVSPEQGALSLAENLKSLFPNLQYVWVTRRDKVRQAVSLVKARQSSQWKELTAQPQRSHAADYNFYAVDLALRQIVREECAWEEYFTRAGITPLTVVYEDLARNYESTVRELLDRLGIDLPREYEFPPPRLRKQADAESDDWVDRYYRDAGSNRAWRAVTSLLALVLRRRLRETYVVPRLRRQADRVLGRQTRHESS